MSSQRKKEILKELCEMAAIVREEIFPDEPADCFCGENPLVQNQDFTFSEEVLHFFRVAIYDAIVKRKGNNPPS